MQNIIFNLENENGTVLETASNNFADVVLELWEVEDFKTKFPWLSSIDPYGITLINVHQMPYLILDLQNLSQAINKPDFSQTINGVLHFLKKIDQHRYVRFIGD